jgi:hypothetical protein
VKGGENKQLRTPEALPIEIQGRNMDMADDKKIMVLNPLGQPPPIKLEPMAPRPDTLDGKTVYVVDVKFPNSKIFAEELMKVLKEHYPGTNWLYREKTGSYFDDDPALWAEIKERGHGMVQLTGH